MIKSRLRLSRLALVAAAGLAGCASPAPPGAAAPPAARAPLPLAARPAPTPRALAAELDARLEQLRRQQEPASDDVIASLERALDEQREKRARVAAANVPLPAAAASAPATRPPKPAKAAPRLSRAAQARAAAASAAAASAAAPGSRVSAEAATAQALAARSPMARVDESRRPVDDLYARARDLELQLKAAQAVALYREASQRGHAPSSERLMALYADGAPGVERDYRVAVFFKARAVQQGVHLAADWHR